MDKITISTPPEQMRKIDLKNQIEYCRQRIIGLKQAIRDYKIGENDGFTRSLGVNMNKYKERQEILNTELNSRFD